MEILTEIIRTFQGQKVRSQFKSEGLGGVGHTYRLCQNRENTSTIVGWVFRNSDQNAATELINKIKCLV